MSARTPFLVSLNDTFGPESTEMAEPQAGLVLFLLGLVSGVVAMVIVAAFFVYFRRARSRLPDETEELLQQLEDDGKSFPPNSDSDADNTPDEPDKERAPWEKDADWWRSGD